MARTATSYVLQAANSGGIKSQGEKKGPSTSFSLWKDKKTGMTVIKKYS